MHQKKLFNGGSGGFDGYGATSRNRNGHVQGKYNGFVGISTIRNVIVPAKHTYVITGAIVVLVLDIGWTFINAEGIGGESKIPIGKIGKLRIGINLVEGLATPGYFSQCICIIVE